MIMFRNIIYFNCEERYEDVGMGRTRANSVCFAKTWIKIGAFPNATPTSKIWKKL